MAKASTGHSLVLLQKVSELLLPGELADSERLGIVLIPVHPIPLHDDLVSILRQVLINAG